MNKISSGLLLLLGAGALGVFWVNGYLAAWTGEISSRIGGTATKTPIVLPKLATGAVGDNLTARLPAVPAIHPIGAVA